MIGFLIDKLHDPRFMTMLLAAIAAAATAYTLIMPLFAGEGLEKRMKAVASERERIRARERERLSKTEKVSLRQTPKQLVSKVVEDFNLGKWLAQEAAREKLIMAGYRGHAPYVTFLFFRLVTPIIMFAAAVLYVFVISHLEKSFPVKIGMCVAAAFPSKSHFEAPALDQARLSGRARSAADLHRGRHVDRNRVPQGQRRDRGPVGGAVGGIHPDHRRALLPAGSQGRLREPGEANRP
jgi:hypothetical protein